MVLSAPGTWTMRFSHRPLHLLPYSALVPHSEGEGLTAGRGARTWTGARGRRGLEQDGQPAGVETPEGEPALCCSMALQFT